VAKKLIWDLPVRIVHWLLAILICGSYYTVEITGDMDTHMLIGQTILGLLLFRVVWGFVGTRYARFGSFVFKPKELVSYAGSLFSRNSDGYPGHNPTGAIAIYGMLLLVGIQVTTGLFATDQDFYEGPLNHLVSSRTGNQITEIHEASFNILAALILVHVVAIFFYLFFKRENLIVPMLTGRKPDHSGSLEEIGGSKLGLAAAVMLVVAAAVYAVVNFI